MSAPVARVQGKAPHWSGTAVINGDFEEISLDKYAGSFVCVHLDAQIRFALMHGPFCCTKPLGEYLVFFFYPNDLYGTPLVRVVSALVNFLRSLALSCALPK